MDKAGRIPAQGRPWGARGAHPRLAHMAVRAGERGQGALAADIAALLSERDIVKARPGERDCDLRLRIELLQGRGAARDLPRGSTSDRGAIEQVKDAARQWRHQLRVGGEAVDPKDTGSVVALAYPDRIAQRRPGAPRSFRLAGGSGALFPSTDPLAAE